MKNLYLLLISIIAISNFVNSQVVKKVLFEEYTYVGCGNCPEGHYVMDEILNNFTNVIGVCHHMDDFVPDAMYNIQSDAIATVLSGGAPMVSLDRVQFSGWTYPSYALLMSSQTEVENKLTQQLAEMADVEIAFAGTYNTTTRALDFTVVSTFYTIPTTGDMRLNVFLIEDSITGSGIGYDQTSYYNNQTGHPFYGAGNPIPNYTHKHSVRDFLSDTWGDTGVIPSSPALATAYSKSYNFTIPASYNENQVSLVAFVSYFNTSVDSRQVLNANDIKISDLVITNINSEDRLANTSIYPNPSSGLIYIKADGIEQVEIINLQGKQIYTGKETEINLSSQPKGIYIIKVRTSKGVVVKKIVLE